MTPDATIEARAWLATPRIAVLLLVALPILVNAIALFPEVRYSTPSDNDEIFHYLFIERANQALAAGDNPFDHWLPELEAGFAQFHYYQNLPHLTVVAIHHLLLERVGLLSVLDSVRYLLMVLFPLTVYWSMRRMDFSLIASAVSAAFCSTLSSTFQWGFDFRSYIWGGYGMFPQLCSMHLMFIGTACLRRVLERSKGFAAAALVAAAVVLSDLLYGYIFAIAAVILWVLSVLQRAARATGTADIGRGILRLTARFAIVTLIAVLISAYQTLPFFRYIQYINNAYPQYPRHLGRTGFHVTPVLTYLFGGMVFDFNRLPVVTSLILLGILYSLVTRSDQAKLALAFFVTYLFLTLGRAILGPLADLIPLARIVPFQRLIAGADLGAILLVGLAGEFIWRLSWNWLPSSSSRIPTVVPLMVLLILCVVPLTERWSFYRGSAHQMEASLQALREDQDLPQVISALRAGSQGRVYAGTRGNWGEWMRVGGVHLYDLLPIERFETLMPWQTLSLNSPYLWHLNIPDLKVCRLFNIRYVVAPPMLRVPQSYRQLVATPGYTLYEIDSGGYMQLGQIEQVSPMAFNTKLYDSNRDWIAGEGPSEGRFIAFRSRDDKLGGELEAFTNPDPRDDAPKLGLIEHEVETPDSVHAQVTANTKALLVIKVTYHPNWHVAVDGHEQHSFMVSPSFIGTMLTPGHHEVSAEYRSGNLKKVLLLIGLLTLAAMFVVWAFDLEQRLFRGISG